MGMWINTIFRALIQIYDMMWWYDIMSYSWPIDSEMYRNMDITHTTCEIGTFIAKPGLGGTRLVQSHIFFGIFQINIYCGFLKIRCRKNWWFLEQNQHLLHHLHHLMPILGLRHFWHLWQQGCLNKPQAGYPRTWLNPSRRHGFHASA